MCLSLTSVVIGCLTAGNGNGFKQGDGYEDRWYPEDAPFPCRHYQSAADAQMPILLSLVDGGSVDNPADGYSQTNTWELRKLKFERICKWWAIVPFFL